MNRRVSPMEKIKSIESDEFKPRNRKTFKTLFQFVPVGVMVILLIPYSKVLSGAFMYAMVVAILSVTIMMVTTLLTSMKSERTKKYHRYLSRFDYEELSEQLHQCPDKKTYAALDKYLNLDFI